MLFGLLHNGNSKAISTVPPRAEETRGNSIGRACLQNLASFIPTVRQSLKSSSRASPTRLTNGQNFRPTEGRAPRAAHHREAAPASLGRQQPSAGEPLGRGAARGAGRAQPPAPDRGLKAARDKQTFDDPAATGPRWLQWRHDCFAPSAPGRPCRPERGAREEGRSRQATTNARVGGPGPAGRGQAGGGQTEGSRQGARFRCLLALR